MRKTIYVCDHCEKDMENSPAFTVSFRSNSLAVQEPGEWHYCHDCWGQVRTFLSTKNNVSWVKVDDQYGFFITTTTTSDEEKITQGKPIINDKFTHSSPYMSYTISTNGEKTIQAKPAGDGPFTIGCWCENTNKDSLNYKQVTEI